MEAEARYTIVGAAVLALVAALVAAVLMLADTGRRSERLRYAIHFEHQALDGLQVGADVRLRGIKVGRVEDYALAEDSVNRVRVEISVGRRAPVRTNTVAVVTRNIVTGIASIALITDEPAGPPLTDVAAGESLPVIGEGRSDLEQITGRVSELGEQASIALANLNLLLTAENRQATMETVRNLRDLSGGLAARLDALDRTLERTGSAAAAVGAAAGRIAATAEGTGRSLEGAIAQAHDTFARAAAAITRAEAAIAQGEQTIVGARTALEGAAGSIGRMERQIGSTARRVETTAESAEDQLAAVIAELRLTLASASRTFDRLNDPRAALLGPGPSQLGPGEKKP